MSARSGLDPDLVTEQDGAHEAENERELHGPIGIDEGQDHENVQDHATAEITETRIESRAKMSCRLKRPTRFGRLWA